MMSILGNMGVRNIPTLGIMGSEIVPLDVSWDHQVPTTLLAKTGSQRGWWHAPKSHSREPRAQGWTRDHLF